MINSIKEDKQLLMFIDSDMRDLGISSYPRESVVEAIRNGAASITIEGQQEFPDHNGQQRVDYSLALKQYIAPNYYQPIALLARISEEPGKIQIFKLNGEGYFTLPEAVNLLNGRPVAKKELVGKKIQESWFALDTDSKDVYGSSSIIKTPLSDELLTTSINQFPVKEFIGRQQDLISSLKKGSLVPVTLLKNGIETKAFAIVRPESNSIDIVTRSEMRSKESQSSTHRKSRRM